MTGKEVSEKIVLNEETKSRIIENGYRIAMQRKKNMKKHRQSTVVIRQLTDAVV